ncbi:MAG: hypothetical protein Q8O67_07180 [Deltaproteobacteria bacterium]|nr:hypothetical protein [Deltaproteobacteria bacterium]
MAQRLDTAFSRVLLDGKAGVAVPASALENIIQQQLIHGGTLDTLMLETGLLDEEQVQAALSLAWKTSAVDVKALQAPDPAAVKLLPERMAVALGVAPFAVDGEGGALHVVVRGPLDQGLVDEVAALIRTKVVAHVVPEVRVWQALHHAYKTPIEERFLALLRQVSPQSSPPENEAQPTTTTTARTPNNETAVEWDLIEAMAHLAAQDSRDGIARVATQYTRKFLPFAAVFGVRVRAVDPECIGWHRQGSAEGALFSGKPFIVPEDCLVAAALDAPTPFFGKPPLSEGNAAFFGWLGRRRPKTILLVPIVVARRPVACLFADGGIRPRDPSEVGDLIAFSARLGPAFEALLRQRHRAHPSLFPQPAPTIPPSTMPPIPADDDDDAAEILPAPDAPPALVEAPPPPRRSADTWSETTVPMPPQTTALDTVADAPLLAPESTQAAETMPPTPAIEEPPPAPTTTTTTALEPPPLAPPPLPPEPPPAAHRDGTSPFARSYVPSPKMPAIAPEPARAAAAANDDVDESSFVLSGIGAPLLDAGLALRAAGLAAPMPDPTGQDGHEAPDHTKSTLFAVDDAVAPAVWTDALQTTVEQGLQGGTVNDPMRRPPVNTEWDDTGWEEVVYDPAHAKELEKAPTTTARQPSDLSFPELSTSTLAGLYGDDENTLTEPSDAPARGTRDPPLSTLSHRDLTELLFAGDDELVARAARELGSRGLACVPALSERFPGRLRVDPFDAGENVRSADRLGAVVDVLARLGPDGLDAAIPHVDSRYPAHRFAAVLLFSLTPDARAIDLLRARLHDQEPRIRELAAEALMPFLAHPRFETLLIHLRERTSTSSKPYPLESRRRAVELLGQFRDVGAIPLLVALLSTELAETARHALRGIALQDYGARPRGWEKWWAKAKKRSRLDWLIDALSSEELELRTEAHRELQALAGDDFGYRPDGDKRTRARAIEVWQQWWSDEKARAPRPAAIART